MRKSWNEQMDRWMGVDRWMRVDGVNRLVDNQNEKKN